MAHLSPKPSFGSGIDSLDHVLQGVLAGDNVVWQVDDALHQVPFVRAFCGRARQDGKKLVYFRFARHPPLVEESWAAETHVLEPRAGFEQFITRILDVINACGKGACYVFDCLSELAVDWYSDRMLGNFFKLACPYLYAADTVAYFSLLRNTHTPLSVKTIHATAQVVLDLYRSKGCDYILPLKVLGRHTPTMYMLHARQGDCFRPVTSSMIISEILATTPQPWLDGKITLTDTWSRTLREAQQACDAGRREGSIAGERAFLGKMVKMVVSRDSRLARLCERYFDLCDLVAIGKRMVGTGLIGGKATGMLLARAILNKTDDKWQDLLETHDSFFIGSDVFYSFVINNKCWWERYKMKSAAEPLKAAAAIRKKLLAGKFQRDTVEQFREMLNYFGQSPIIVRSSSLLEDAYGNAFSGKYESVFCANRGTPEERLEQFKNAVRTVYASTMSQEVLSYRADRGLWSRYEEMALLVQRVSGAFYQDIYLPHLAGVGYSFNPFAWSPDIDPQAGLLRLVFGLGTRAVDRHDDDYTRIVALNAPHKRPEVGTDQVYRYSQHKVDLIDLARNAEGSATFEEVVAKAPDLPLELFADRDLTMEERAARHGVTKVFSWVLTFEKLFRDTAFITDMREMLATLAAAYAYPVDIEFAVNFAGPDHYRINLLQCRPFQVRMEGRAAVPPPRHIATEDIVLKSAGPIIGEAVSGRISRVIYVRPEKYHALATTERYGVARLIGELVRQPTAGGIMLIGPGRWGSTMPELGVPVACSDVKNVKVLCELATMHANLSPDISLGTHFFNDIVEMGIVYLGVYPEPQRQGYLFSEALLLGRPNQLAGEAAARAGMAEVIHLVDMVDDQQELIIHTDPLKQQAVLFQAGRRA